MSLTGNPEESRTGPDPDEPNTHSYETDRLLVELPRPEDAETLYSLIGGEDRREICATLVWDGPESLNVSEEWVESCRSKPFGEWGKGIMTETLRGLLDYGFSALDLAKIEAEVFTHNIRGRRLVEGVGMKQEGTIRRSHRKYGAWVDTAMYGILAEEWPPQT